MNNGFFISFHITIFAIFICATLPASEALALPPGKRASSNALTRHFGSAAALSGGGTASVSDLSAVDLNPAGVANGKKVELTGEFGWTGSNIHSSEVGVIDSLLSDVAAGTKVRQTSKVTGGLDRRYSLALADRVLDTSIIFGIGGDYIQIESPDSYGNKNRKDYQRLRFGATYAFTDTVQLGFRSEGYFDDSAPNEHALGIAASFGAHFLGNIDAVFSNDGIKAYIAGINVSAKEFLDLYLSYGYEQNPNQSKGGAGLVIKSSKFRLYYTASKYLIRETRIQHTFGAAFVTTM